MDRTRKTDQINQNVTQLFSEMNTFLFRKLRYTRRDRFFPLKNLAHLSYFSHLQVHFLFLPYHGKKQVSRSMELEN